MAKKSSITGIIIAIVAVAVVVAGAIWVKGYYDSTYVGQTYYSRVPEDAGISLQTIKSDSGEDVGTGYDYELTAYNEKGESKTVSFVQMADDAADLYQSGTYLKVEASKTRVISQKAISEGDVPSAILSKLK